MSVVKRTFYILLGFTFPFFWGFHMEGFAAILYRPIQMVAFTESTIWPSFITASLLYVGMIVLVEKLFRTPEIESPGLQQLHQQVMLDRESLLQDRDTEDEIVPRYNTADSEDHEILSQMTDLLSRQGWEMSSEH